MRTYEQRYIKLCVVQVLMPHCDFSAKKTVLKISLLKLRSYSLARGTSFDSRLIVENGIH